MWRIVLVLSLFAGCATELQSRQPVAWKAPDLANDGGRCPVAPSGGRAGFDHARSRVAVALGDPRHRGIDLIASTTSERHVLEGEIKYGVVDKSLEDEVVDVYACIDRSWRFEGSTRTDEDGHFALALASTHRLPAGLRDLYARVAGDDTGVGFVAYVAPPGAAVVVTDVDGTLTSSENAIVASVVFGTDPGVRGGAADVFQQMAARGDQPIYLTARGRWYVENTRRWLAAHGMPRGPVIVAPGMFTRPGRPTLEHKTRSLARIRDAGFDIAAGVGNRASDIAAYAAVGLDPDRIFIEAGQYDDELAPAFHAHRATRFASYAELGQLLTGQRPASRS